VTPDGTQLYVTNANISSVTAINTSTLGTNAKIAVGLLPSAVSVSSDGTTAYVTNAYGYSLTEINTSNNTVKCTLAKVGIYPYGIALYH
jgi:YVTN family beta-propeller protein